MKKTLCIGNTTVDVIIKIDNLPSCTDDVNIKDQQLLLGGCPFNVYDTLTKFTNFSAQLCSVIGSGIYGAFVRNTFQQRHIPIFANLHNIPNGCCYCLVDKNGERSFMALHGAEYLFNPKWMASINLNTVDSVYICGLELEESTGKDLVSWLETLPETITIYFAPGPRFCLIEKELIKRIFKLHPVIHINEAEALSYTYSTTVETAAKNIIRQTLNTVIITLGEKGSMAIVQISIPEPPYIKYEIIYTQAVPVKKENIADTIGAGDSHIAAFIAYTKRGLPIKKALSKANEVSAKIVQTKGAHLEETISL
jgi:sugar/nucleoside kinase (ribokinase family)